VRWARSAPISRHRTQLGHKSLANRGQWLLPSDTGVGLFCGLPGICDFALPVATEAPSYQPYQADVSVQYEHLNDLIASAMVDHKR